MPPTSVLVCAAIARVVPRAADGRPRPNATSNRALSGTAPNGGAMTETQANAQRMERLVAELRERLVAVRSGGGPEAAEKHRRRNKLTARERVERLIDPGSDFLEFSALAATDMYDNGSPSAGILTGIGVVEGQYCIVIANDATVKGGTYYPMTVKKHLRAQEV